MNNGKVNPIPEGYRSITPFLLVKDANGCMKYMQDAFGAAVVAHHLHADGSLMHGVVQIGDSRIMLGEASEKYPAAAAMLYLYVEDTDATYKKAMDAGGTSLREPVDEFYGDRSAGVMDKWNNQWWIATHVEDVSPEEMEKRQQAYK